MSVFFGGIPTGPDIRLLREMYPDSELGETVIPYQKVAEILRCDRNSNRFKTITNRWRKLVEVESGKVLGVKKGEGFVVLNDREKLDLSWQKLRTAARCANRSRVVASRVSISNLSSEDRARLEHNSKVSSGILAVAQIKSNQPLPTMEASK
jgi:hypothetical protein